MENNQKETASWAAVAFIVVCLGLLFAFVMAISSSYPYLLKIRHINKSFNRSWALQSKLLENKDLLKVCYPYGDDPGVKQCPETTNLQVTFESISAHQIKICEGTFFKNCTIFETADEAADFSAAVYVFFPDDFQNFNEDFFGRPLDYQRTAVVWTTLDNQTSVEQAAAWLVEGIKHHRRTESDKSRNADEKARDCRTNRIVNDCD